MVTLPVFLNGVGERELSGLSARLSDTPGKIRNSNPLLGEHNDWSLKKLLADKYGLIIEYSKKEAG